MRTTLLIVIALIFNACADESDERSVAQNNSVSPDSTAYYDSLYAPLRDSVDGFFRQKISERRFNGAYLFAENGRIISEGYYGYANWKTKDTLTLNHAFQLASASKPFTATAILQLIDKGSIDPDADVREYIPNLPYEGISIRMLLSHRGGLGNYTYFTEKYWKDTIAGEYLTNNDVIYHMVVDTPMIYYPPDKNFDYSNTGYALLASIVECVSGMPFKDYMRQHIFEPAGMKNSFILDKVSGNMPEHVTTGHLWNYRLPGNDYLNGVVGDKGMYASVRDLFNYDNALRNGKILSTENCVAMTSPQSPIKPDSTCYGYGWRLINPDTEKEIVYHTGWWQGHRSYFIRYPRENKLVVVLDNVKRGPFFSVRKLLGLITEDYP